VPCTVSLITNTVEVVWLDFREKIRGDEEGGNDFKKKENVRRGLLGTILPTFVMPRRLLRRDSGISQVCGMR